MIILSASEQTLPKFQFPGSGDSLHERLSVCPTIVYRFKHIASCTPSVGLEHVAAARYHHDETLLGHVKEDEERAHKISACVPRVLLVYLHNNYSFSIDEIRGKLMYTVASVVNSSYNQTNTDLSRQIVSTS